MRSVDVTLVNLSFERVSLFKNENVENQRWLWQENSKRKCIRYGAMNCIDCRSPITYVFLFMDRILWMNPIE